MSRPPPLPNPERRWKPRPGPATNPRAAVEERLGEVPGNARVLGGGQANLNLLLDGDRVLRVYTRDPAAASREAALLTRPWSSFRVPGVLDAGEDFLVLEHVPHEPLAASRAHGEAAGRALAEIHANHYAGGGFLSGDLEVEEPFPNAIDGYLTHLRGLAWENPSHATLGEDVVDHLEARRSAIAPMASQPVLLHGDYKASNLHWTDEGELLVLDWEFAYAGPALADVGQLFRWDPGDGFRDGFLGGYWGDAGAPDGWFEAAEALDLVNLADLLARSAPGSRRERDVQARVRATLARG